MGAETVRNEKSLKRLKGIDLNDSFVLIMVRMMGLGREFGKDKIVSKTQLKTYFREEI